MDGFQKLIPTCIVIMMDLLVQSIFDQVIAGEPDNVRALLRYEVVKKILQRVRVSNIPASPDTIEEFIDQMVAK